MDALKEKLFPSLIYPCMISLGIGGILWASSQKISLGIAVPAVSAVLLALVLFLEWQFPYSLLWRKKKQEYQTDILHLLISQTVPTKFFDLVLQGFLVSLSAALSSWYGAGLWPSKLPILLQLLLALFLGDFFAYWLHRIMHEVDWLWKFHAIHHSSEKMDWLSSSRTHPVNSFLTYSLQALPLVLFGASGEVIALVTVFTAANGMLQHANIKMDTKLFHYIFATPNLHRWHHAKDIPTSCTNYGNNTIVWDILFGTRNLPSKEEIAPDLVGLDEEFPQGYLDQLLYPFKKH